MVPRSAVSSLSIGARLQPRRRPDAPRTGSQLWRNLLFVHWEVEPTALRRAVPSALDLDLFEGRAFVGAVPFEMRQVQPHWLPRELAFQFLETNLRTYVSYRGEPGVYFFSLEAASWLAVQAARIGWSLPYYHARMDRGQDRDGPSWYRSRRRSTPNLRRAVTAIPPGGRDVAFEAHYTVGEPLPPPAPGSLEFFLLERYLLFSLDARRVQRGQVHHAPYPVHAATLHAWHEDLFEAAGLSVREEEPACVHFSRGVDVETFGPRAVGPATSP